MTMKPLARIIAVALICLVGLGLFVYLDQKQDEDWRQWINDKFELASIGNCYRAFESKHSRSPARLEELDELSPVVREKIRDGYYVIRWSVPLTGKDDDTRILGYSTIQTRRGVIVLYGDGGTITRAKAELQLE